MKTLAKDLKEMLPSNHKYIDKITSYSPNYKRVSRKQARFASFMGTMNKSQFQSLAVNDQMSMMPPEMASAMTA